MSTFDDQLARDARYLWDADSGVEVVERGNGEAIDVEALFRLFEGGQANDADGPAVRTFNHHGLTCVVETPKGSVRSGKAFAIEMPAHYGYVDGIKGADGDSLDMYYGDGPTNGWVYVIDQRHLDSKKFDEHKCMLNFSSMREALDAYMAGHHRAKDVYMDMTPMPISEFTAWTRTHDMRKPCGQ